MLVYIYFLLFEISSDHTVLAGLELYMQTRMALKCAEASLGTKMPGFP